MVEAGQQLEKGPQLLSGTIRHRRDAFPSDLRQPRIACSHRVNARRTGRYEPLLHDDRVDDHRRPRSGRDTESRLIDRTEAEDQGLVALGTRHNIRERPQIGGAPIPDRLGQEGGAGRCRSKNPELKDQPTGLKGAYRKGGRVKGEAAAGRQLHGTRRLKHLSTRGGEVRTRGQLSRKRIRLKEVRVAVFVRRKVRPVHRRTNARQHGGALRRDVSEGQEERTGNGESTGERSRQPARKGRTNRGEHFRRGASTANGATHDTRSPLLKQSKSAQPTPSTDRRNAVCSRQPGTRHEREDQPEPVDARASRSCTSGAKIPADIASLAALHDTARQPGSHAASEHPAAQR